MCNGDKKPISHVTPSNGVNTTHARTPTLKEKKRFVFNLKTRFLRETNPRPSDFALGRPTTELQYSIKCYTIMKFIVSSIWHSVGNSFVERIVWFIGRGKCSSYLICSLWSSFTCWIVIISLITRTRIAILIFTSNNRNISSLIFVYCPSAMV